MNTICGIGVSIFLLYFIYDINRKSSFHKYIPLILFWNGILYHIVCDNMKNIDLLVNICLCIYINIYTPKQPYSIYLTTLVLLIYLINMYINSNILHVLLILTLLLHIYIKSKKDE